MGGRTAIRKLNVRHGAAALLALLAAALVAPSASDATTGAHPLANPPKYHVSHAEARPYIGRFQLARPHGKGLMSAAYVARFNEFGYLEGSLVVYAYTKSGRTTSWVGTTYEYHPRGHRRMTIDVISPNNQVIFARLRLRAGRGGRLSGRLLQLRPAGPTQAISLSRVGR
ncbi:MAG: hypothetical protein QM729_11645 [Solirubrobacterales bacterium]